MVLIFLESQKKNRVDLEMEMFSTGGWREIMTGSWMGVGDSDVANLEKKKKKNLERRSNDIY